MSDDLRARIRDALDADDHRYPHARMPSDVRELLPLVLAELDRLDGENAKLRDRLASALGWVNLAANLLRPEENR